MLSFLHLSLYSPHTPDGAASRPKDSPDGAASPRLASTPVKDPGPRSTAPQAPPDGRSAPAKPQRQAPSGPTPTPPNGPAQGYPIRLVKSGLCTTGLQDGPVRSPAALFPSLQPGPRLCPHARPTTAGHHPAARDGRGPRHPTGGHPLGDSDYRGPLHSTLSQGL